MSKLTKTDKEAIIASIIADVLKPDQSKLRDEMQKALVKGMSRACQNLYKKSPEALRTVYANYAYGLDRGVELVSGDANHKDILEPFSTSYQERRKVLNNIGEAVMACTTRKQFVDRFPELTSYLPTESAPCPTLPAIANAVADLVRIGFVPKVTKS